MSTAPRDPGPLPLDGLLPPGVTRAPRWVANLIRCSFLVGLFSLSAWNFQFFHAVAELYCVGVSVAIVAYAWNSRQIVNDPYGQVLGLGYGWLALLDLVHALTFPGMSVFPDVSTDQSIQLWLAARVLQALALLTAALLARRPVHVTAVLLAGGALTTILGALVVHTDALPVFFDPVAGTTLAKTLAEAAVIALLAAALAFTWRARPHLEADTVRLMAWSISLTMVSEALLAGYRSPFGFGSVVGHLLKVIAFYYAYRAILWRGSQRPYQILFRDVVEGRARFAAVFERMRRPALVLAPDGAGAFVVRRANPSAASFFGRPLDQIEGRTCSELIAPEHAAVLREVLAAAWAQREWPNPSMVIRAADGTLTSCIEPDVYRIPGDEVVLVLRDRTEEMRTFEALQRTGEELRRLHEARDRKLEDERRRIAQELHDELGQVATAMTLGLDRVARRTDPVDPGLTAAVVKLKGLAASTVGTIRRICAELRPSQLDLLGLPEALEAKLRDFEEETGIEAGLTSTIDGPALDRDLTTALYRIAQESLTNVARHSFAGRVQVSLSADGALVRLVVEDDGRGITEREVAAETSFGVLGMRERARALGGRLEIGGRPDGGTRVVATVPRTRTPAPA